MTRNVFLFLLFFASFTLNAENYSIVGDTLQIEFNIDFEEKLVYMPESGFLHNPFNSEKNVYLCEIQGTKLIVYNFPTVEYIQKSKFNEEDLFKWRTMWNLEKQKITGMLKAKVAIKISNLEIMKDIETIEIRLVYYVGDYKDVCLISDKISYKTIILSVKHNS